MDVPAFLEGLAHGRVSGHGGHDAQLNLGIVRGKHGVFTGGGNKGRADQPPLFRPYRNILQIGILGGQPSRGRQHLVELGVDAAVLRADVLGQGVQVGALQLHVFPVGQDVFHDGMERRQGGKGFLIRDELPGFRLFGLLHQLQFPEKEIAELLGGIQVERVARGRLDLCAQVLNDGPHLDGSFFQRLRKNTDTREFHVCEHRQQGKFHRAEQFLHAAVRYLFLQNGRQLKGDVRIFRGIPAHHFHGNILRVQFPFFGPRRGNVAQLDGGILQQGFRQNVHAVLHAGRDQRVGQHRIEKRAGYVDAVGAHHLEVELEVVADFFRRAFKKGPHRFQVFRTGDGQVPGFVGFGAEGDAQQGVRHRIQARRLRVETPGIVPVQFRGHGVAGLLCVRNDVFVPDVVHGFQLALFKQFHLSRSRLLRRGGRDGSLPRLGGSEQIVCGKGGGRSGGRNLPAEQLGLHGAELQFLKEAQQFVRPGLLLDKLVKGYG